MDKTEKPTSLREAHERFKEQAARQQQPEPSQQQIEDPELVDDDAGESDSGLLDPIPEWATMPADMRLPSSGKRIYHVRFLARWTDAPEKGDRTCILWGLTYNDEKLALARCRGESARTISEYTMQMIRAVDGEKANWTMRPSNVQQWWEEIGAKCRQILTAHYLRTHVLTQEDKALFFVSCFAETSSR